MATPRTAMPPGPALPATGRGVAQACVTPRGPAAGRRAGALSLKLTLLKGITLLGLLRVKTICVVAPVLMLAGVNAAPIVGKASVLSVTELLVAPTPFSADETAPVVLL